MRALRLPYSLLLLTLFAYPVLAEEGPWVGVYKSTVPILPDELVQRAQLDGEDIDQYYPKLRLDSKGNIETHMLGKLENRASYEIRGKQLITTYTDPNTGKQATDPNPARFSADYSTLTLGQGADEMVFIRLESAGKPQAPTGLIVQ